jgi:uncharacterized metal-binding protein YceD (DUF177 family)
LKSLKQYSIPFTGLKIGHHHFTFEVDSSFFNDFEYSLVKQGLLKVELEMEKQETMLVLDFHTTGTIQLNCDRCLAEYAHPLEVKDRLIAKFSNIEDLNDAEEVLVLSKNDSEVDVSSFIYEMINLAAPYVNVCEEPGKTNSCDLEMIAKLNELSEEQEEESDDSDPRWDILKNITKN